MSNPRPVTLITGASAGIGAALAQVFAANGHELVLVARRAARLEALADSIAATGGSRPRVLPADLTRGDACDCIAGELRAQSLEPEIVVNSAGFGLSGLAAEIDRAAQLAMIDLNVRALTDLSLRFIDSLARHRGGLLNVGSVLGFLPGPQMAVYHATKAYVLSFTEALHHELKPHGIRVTALCPGPVETEFGVRPDGYFSRKALRTVGRIAREGFEGLKHNRRIVVTGFDNNVLRQLPRVMPRRLALTMMNATRRKRIEVNPG